ncbi:hypothetical protein CBS9595_002486 [Malassezia furfur]|nr:hypothetical protein CBS9595_002486 [Malassezia furfur]
MREAPVSPPTLRGPRDAPEPRGLNLAAQVAAQREVQRTTRAASDTDAAAAAHAVADRIDADADVLRAASQMREERARAAEARRTRLDGRARVPSAATSEPEQGPRSQSAPAARPARALPPVPGSVPATAPHEAVTDLPNAQSIPALLAQRAALAMPRRSSYDAPSPAAVPSDPVPVPAPALTPSPELGGVHGWGLGAVLSAPATRQGTPPADAPRAHTSLDETPEARDAREAQETRVAQAALHARLARTAQAAPRASRTADTPMARGDAAEALDPAAGAAEAASVRPASPLRAPTPPAPALPVPEPVSGRATPVEAPVRPASSTARTEAPAPPLTNAWTSEPPEAPHELPGAFPAPAPPLVPLAVPETSTARTTHGRRESRRSRRRGDATHTLLAALSTPATGPGNPMPSLYGYFSDEPAPTALRPAGVGYGAGAARATVPAAPGTETIGRMHPGLAERILASGPSVSNLHPVASAVQMSPGAGARATAAQLRRSEVQPGSVAFPAGALSDIGSTSARARDAHVSHKLEENTVLSFAWTVEHLGAFAEQVRTGERRHKAWNMYPLFGEERWRLEWERTQGDGHGGLALHLTCLTMMALAFHAELPTQVMFGLRAPQRLRRAPGMLASDLVWRTFVPFKFDAQHDTLTFTDFPPLADVCADAAIAEQDAVELVVQIAAGPSVHTAPLAEANHDARLPFETPSTVQMPRSLVHALAHLVDDAGTGDLMIIVREKGLQQHPSAELAASVGLKTFVQPWPTGTPMPVLNGDAEPDVYVRDRVLWAHASVLRARSEFFDTMLSSEFSESAQHDVSGATRAPGWRRPYRVLRIPDADYVTLYWFLRYLYTDEVQLLPAEDIQAVTLDDHWILGQEGASDRPDWKWRHVYADEDDASTLASSPGAADTSVSSRLAQTRTPLLTSATTNPTLTDLHSGHNVEITTSPRDGTPQCRPTKTHGRQRSGGASSALYASDPHPHPPMLAVPPASALALYRLAHRYHLPTLCELTTAHIIAQLTPQNATNYLLCTALFEQLQYAIQHYIFQHWHDVSSSEEFERCCDQVSEGDWGPSAGRALASLMRNLRLAETRSGAP